MHLGLLVSFFYLLCVKIVLNQLFANKKVVFLLFGTYITTVYVILLSTLGKNNNVLMEKLFIEQPFAKKNKKKTQIQIKKSNHYYFQEVKRTTNMLIKAPFTLVDDSVMT